MTRTEGAPGRLFFCLPEGGVLAMGPGSQPDGIEGLLPSVRLRKVDAGDLASYPDGGAEPEAD